MTIQEVKDYHRQFPKNLERFKNGEIIPYYGFLNGECICEATAMINPSIVQNSEGLVGEGIVYLSAFRTNKEYQGQGYFSKLFCKLHSSDIQPS